MALLAVPAPSAEADDTTTLTGAFRWNSGSPNDLRAVFTPTGEGTWDVAFHFKFRGSHVYKGVAEGSLTDGGLKGKVKNDNKERTFTFEGSFEDGEFKGTHAEIGRSRGSQSTGTFWLGG